MDVETEQMVYACEEDKFFVPASLQKIPLSVAAVLNLSDEFRFQTTLAYEGSIKDGVLQGNLWIKGGGDPTLSLEIFFEWEQALKAKGICSVEGKIIVDPTIFESAMASPFWYFEDLGNYFGAGASGLSINKNLYKITFKKGEKEGDPASVVQINPEIPYLVFENEVTTGPAGSGDGVYIFGSEYSPKQFYRGTVPIDHENFTVKAAIPDPSLFCGLKLSEMVSASQGVEVLKEKREASLLVIHEKKSFPLRKILSDLNHFSINLYAEHLFKTIGRGMGSEGIRQIDKIFKQLGMSFYVQDGCGLARTNLITPKEFAKLLCAICKNPRFESINESFPKIGEGTLKSFPPIPRASIRAKSGFMNMISNLGGYLKLDSGKEFAFCICCNNYVGSLQDAMNATHKLLTVFVESQMKE